MPNWKHISILLAIWIGFTAKAAVTFYNYHSFSGAIPFLIYALGLTAVHFINRKGKFKKETHELLSFGVEFGAALPIGDLLADFIEYLAK